MSGDLTSRLRAAGCVYAEEEAALLLREADGSPGRLRELAAARISGRPLEAVLGWAEFAGLRIAVAPGVFVPRRRTTLLARLAADGLWPGATVVELCCGTGAVSRALLAAEPRLDLWAGDLDPAAVDCARRNLPELGTERVQHSDLFDALPVRLRGRVETVVANAPYVPTEAIALMPTEARDHEHRIALDGGPDGVELHRRIAAQAPDWLTPQGRLLIESGREQAHATAAAMQSHGFDTRIQHDPEVDGTVVIGSRAPAT